MVRQRPAGTEAWTIGRQLLKIGTSVGANIPEADGALTGCEFAHICNIARREGLGRRFWLRLRFIRFCLYCFVCFAQIESVSSVKRRWP